MQADTLCRLVSNNMCCIESELHSTMCMSASYKWTSSNSMCMRGVSHMDQQQQQNVLESILHMDQQ